MVDFEDCGIGIAAFGDAGVEGDAAGGQGCKLPDEETKLER